MWTGAKALSNKPFRAKIKTDGVDWCSGKASCILFGNVSELVAGIRVFDGAESDDGLLEVGVVSAEDALQWGRTLARTGIGSAAESPSAQETKAHTVEAKLSRKLVYELNGGAKTKLKSFKVKVEPRSVTVCVCRRRQMRPTSRRSSLVSMNSLIAKIRSWFKSDQK